MADTIRGNYTDKTCADCPTVGCTVQHWGCLVPKGQSGFFCETCIQLRNDDWHSGKEIKPLGYRKVSEAATV